jgi:hypothetical protein
LAIPAIIIFAGIFAQGKKAFSSQKVGGLCVLAFALIISINSFPQVLNLIFTHSSVNPESIYYKVRDTILENTEPDDEILVLGEGEGATAYYRTNRLSASKYVYYANGNFNEDSKIRFAGEILDETMQSVPKLIMMTPGKQRVFEAHLSADQLKAWQDFMSENYEKLTLSYDYNAYKLIGANK